MDASKFKDDVDPKLVMKIQDDIYMSVIETKNLTKSYGKTRGIIDVNQNIEDGEIFGFVGLDGVGKSTTIRTLLELIYPTIGRATIFWKTGSLLLRQYESL